MNPITKFFLSCLKSAKLSDTNNKQHFVCKATRLPETIGHSPYNKHGIEPKGGKRRRK